MKKRIIILSILTITAILLIASYRSYGIKKANQYASFFAKMAPVFHKELVIKEDAHVEKILRQTPTNLFILIKWGDDEKAYMSITNWMTKAHDFIEIDVVDKSKSIHLYE